MHGKKATPLPSKKTVIQDTAMGVRLTSSPLRSEKMAYNGIKTALVP